MEIRNRFAFKKALINLLSFSSLTILWPLFFTAFSPVAQAEAFQAKVFPAKIHQGDAFIIRVSGLKGSTGPSATFNKGPLRFSNCGKGCFIALGAVDLNAKPGAYRIPLKTGKRKTTLRLRVSKGRFQTIHLTLPEEKVSPGIEAIERINREAALLNLIWE